MKKTKSCIALICAVVMLMTAFVVVPVTANAESDKTLKLTYASCKCDKKCSKCMVKKDCKYRGKSACKCKCNITKLVPSSTSTSHIWTNKKEAIIKATLTVNGKVSTKYVMIGKEDNKKEGNKKEGSKYYWNFKTKDKNGHWSFNDSKRKYGKYYLQELFAMNKTTEKKGTLVITLPKTTYYTNGFFRVYGNTTVNGNECTLVKTNSNPVFINFDNSNTDTKEYDGSSNIIIKDMSVNCSNNNKYYGNGFMYAAHAENLTVCNIGVTNSLYNGHAFQITAMNDVVIENSTFTNCLYYITKDKKGKITGYSKYDKSKLSKYHEIDNGKYGNNLSKREKKIRQKLFSNEIIQIEPDYKETDNDQVFALPTIKMSNDGTVSKNVTIRYCTFSNVMRAIGNHSNRGGRCHIIKIYHNNINNTVGHSIVLSKNKKVYIAANTFDNISIDNIGGYPIYGVKYLVENKWESPFGKSIYYMKKNNVFSNVKSDRKTKEVKLWELASNVKLSKTSINLSLNKSYTLKATVLPALASDKRVKWATSSSKIATVSQNGKVTGKKKGNCIITATSLENNKLVAKCTVTVK